MTKQELRESIRRIIKQELKEAPYPAVADPDTEEDVETDPLISPDEDEEDLTFSPSDLPKVNPKAERAMIKKIIARYDSLTENYDLKPISGFESTEKLMKSALDRLATASQMQDWNLVDEVTSDIYNFLNKI